MSGRNEDFDATREIRFGLVLYGGVSLSIYINGVVQELYRLVRATAPDRDVQDTLRWSDAELTGSEVVYRELGRRLRDGVVADRERADTSVRTRFVVDLITGASAGGINGVFLAKAMAADADLTALEELWIDKGDLSKLLNDKPSAKELKNDRLNNGNKSSLLNSKWMYHQLLKAVRKISETATAKGTRTPYADAIDLWITSTDLEGRVVTVETTDSASLRVEERSNRALFHFAYDSQDGTGELRNDFVDENDAMLAFAARATSGFPVAFEPIRLEDIDDMVAVTDDQKVVRPKSSKDLTGFFPAYDPADINRHSFADGGYLDNKPFEQILTTLPLRRATLKVERRLLYVEPDPGDPPIVSGTVEPKPSIFKVVLDAGTLPRNETISGDVSQIKGFGVASEARKSAYDELTAAIDERLDTMTDESPAAPETVGDGAPLPDKLVAVAAGTSVPLKPRELEALADIVDDWSPTASAHRKARVNGVIDDFANMLARILPSTPQAPGSDFTDTMRELVRWMRDRESSGPPEPGRRRARLLTDREILRRFDVTFHMRRINFLQRRAIDWAVDDLTDDGIRDAQKVRSALDVQFADLRMRARDVRRPATVDGANPCAEQRDKLVQAFRACGVELSPSTGPLPSMATVQAAFEAPENWRIRARLMLLIRAVSSHLRLSLHGREVWSAVSAPDLTQSLRKDLQRRWITYRFYDEIGRSFENLPGENCAIHVFRVSPLDARSLVPDTNDRHLKLAGVAVGHFGAFFSEAWRRNDILWGRLDGAERIIDALIPDAPLEVRADLTSRAQHAILAEAWEDDRTRNLVLEPLAGLVPSTSTTNNPLPPRLDPLHGAPAFRTRQRTPDEPSTKEWLALGARTLRVTNDVSTDATVSSLDKGKQGVVWLGRILKFVANVLELFVNEGLKPVLVRNFLVLLAITGALTGAVGTFTGNSSLARTGWTVLAVCLAARIISDALADRLARRKIWKSTLVRVGTLLALAGGAIGVIVMRKVVPSWIPILYAAAPALAVFVVLLLTDKRIKPWKAGAAAFVGTVLLLAVYGYRHLNDFVDIVRHNR